MFFPVRKNHEIHDQLKVTDLSRTKMTEQFNTIQYCIDNLIPCFSFPIDATKKPYVTWTDVTPTTFKKYIIPSRKGVGIVTGYTHFVIDFDEKKHHPPEEIKEFLMNHCSAVEETPGGFHFWFKIDERTQYIVSASSIKWSNINITGLDIRGKKGISYVAPSHYEKNGGMVYYKWIKGDLSTATVVPDDILTCLQSTVVPDAVLSCLHPNAIDDINLDGATVETFKDGEKITIKITPFMRRCLVKADHIHSQSGHSCFFLTKLKTCFSATANCFSHGKRKVTKELCDTLVEQYWTVEDDNAEILNEYAYKKEEFEKTNFKTLDPVGFYTCINNMWMFRERAQIKTTYENMLLSDGTPFLDKWLKDPYMKTYSKVSNEPSGDPSVFVLPELPPPKFVYQSYDCIPNTDAIAIFDEFIEILANHKQPIKEYIFNWCAHLLQKPLDLPGVALIFVGQKGVGKDTFGDFIGTYMIGSMYYQNYANQLQYFDKHDTFKANQFLVKVEELSKKIVSDENNDNYFKSSITAPTTTINPKNGTPYEVKNCKRIIGTTNHSNALNVEQNERRYIFSVVSPEKMGDHVYWNQLRQVLFAASGALAVANMLLARDITLFNPRSLPENTYLKQIQEDTIDTVQRFVDSVEEGEYTGGDFYRMYKDYCTAEGLYAYTNTKFSTQLLFLKENGSITREVVRNRTKKAVVYIIK